MLTNPREVKNDPPEILPLSQFGAGLHDLSSLPEFTSDAAWLHGFDSFTDLEL